MANAESPSPKVSRIEPSYLGIGKLFYLVRDAVIVGDAVTGQIVLWNEAAARIFGYAEEEALGRRMEDLVPARLKEKHRQGLARYSKSGHGLLVDSGQIVELPAVHKDGTEIFVELTLTPIDSDALTGMFAMAIVRDVTERKTAEEAQNRYIAEVKEANRELEAMNEAMRDFISVASHDLRSPITSILGFAVTMNKAWDSTPDEQKRDFLSIIERSARLLSRIVDDLLTVTKLESGHLEVRKEEVDLRAALGEAVRFYAQTAKTVVNCPDTLTVWVDPDHLRRIIANYVGNAVRYGKPPIEVEARRVGESVEVRVRDTGEGVASDFVPRLFEKFARADTKATRKERGTGLGLSIVRGLARANGGEAWYEPSEPRGSSFVLRLPDPSPVDGSDRSLPLEP